MPQRKTIEKKKGVCLDKRRGLKELNDAKKLGESTWIPLRQNIYVFLEDNATKKHVRCSIQGGPMIAGTAYIALKRRAAGSMAIGN